VEIGGGPGSCELCRVSPVQSEPGQRAVGIEDRHAQRRLAGAAHVLGQKLRDLGVLSNEASDGLQAETGVFVEGVRGRPEITESVVGPPA
jgi:hypothetical protein